MPTTGDGDEASAMPRSARWCGIIGEGAESDQDEHGGDRRYGEHVSGLLTSARARSRPPGGRHTGRSRLLIFVGNYPGN